MAFNHLGLFEGIGGFSLAAKWMNWETKAWCEINPFCQTVLRYHFPDAEGFDDITKTDFTKYANIIDVLTGGFPCQPYSIAGKRKGNEDERHLWPYMLRTIREVQPRWVVAENVFGLVNWDGGLVFHEVQTDLEAAGYEVWSYVLPACAVNAPHRRDRIWFIAYSNTKQREPAQGGLQPEFVNGSNGHTENPNGYGCTCNHRQVEPNERQQGQEQLRGCHCQPNVTDTASKGYEERQQAPGWQNSKENKARVEFWDKRFSNNENAADTDITRWQECCIPAITEREGYSDRNDYANSGNWQKFPTQSPVCGGDDGLPAQLDGITFSRWRNESVKAYGNAIVPQVALQIFKAIEEYETQGLSGAFNNSCGAKTGQR